MFDFNSNNITNYKNISDSKENVVFFDMFFFLVLLCIIVGEEVILINQEYILFLLQLVFITLIYFRLGEVIDIFTAMLVDLKTTLLFNMRQIYMFDISEVFDDFLVSYLEESEELFYIFNY